MSSDRYHLHMCPGGKFGAIGLCEHAEHVWKCFRPNCDAPGKYECAFVADSVSRHVELSGPKPKAKK